MDAADRQRRRKNGPLIKLLAVAATAALAACSAATMPPETAASGPDGPKPGSATVSLHGQVGAGITVGGR